MSTTDTAPAEGPTATRPIGRPRQFDGDDVLATVVELFWEQGYAATSIGDVVARTGLSKSSLYGAFGSKEELFRRALESYLGDHRTMIEAMVADGPKGLAAIDAFFDRVGAQAGGPEAANGCFIVNTSAELGTMEPSVVECGAEHRAILRAGFTTALEGAVDVGEFPADRVAPTANVLVTLALGLAVMIRGGATAEEALLHVEAAKATLRIG
ncbi:MAG: TetR/AcrR family transcriptional regulator [Actinomycetota bacterium]